MRSTCGAPADVVFDGVTLPYPDGASDLVTSLDVLEHLARPERAGHVAEVLRVAGERAVLCCPLGAPELNTAERELAEWYARLSGERSPFLD
ncbi:MAG: methyltransferase domain-containing protein [Solirubrobacteraceae bacterium]